MVPIRRYLFLIATTCLAGCFQQLHAIKLKPDGSGTIEVTTAITHKMAAMMQPPTKATPETGGTPQKVPEFFSEELLKQAATRYGDVTLLSSETINTADHVGAKAIYGFKDITKVKLRETPDTSPPQSGGPKTRDSNDSVSFRFVRRNGNAVLTVVSPDWPPDQQRSRLTNRPTKKANERDAAVLREIFSGMKLAGWIEVEGTIVKTNSSYREGSKVILFEYDFDQILADPEGLDKLAAQDPGSLREAKRSFENMKGVKLSLEPELTIEFR